MKTENKKQFELKIPKTIMESKFIDLPYYAKNSVYAFKVISAKITLVVEYSSTERAIQTRPTEYTTAFNESALPITELEFYTLYNQVTHELYNILIEKETGVANDNI